MGGGGGTKRMPNVQTVGKYLLYPYSRYKLITKNIKMHFNQTARENGERKK